jgi:hypothetical protein
MLPLALALAASVPPCLRAAEPPDSVRRLAVAMVLLTNSFNKTLTPAEVERVHEEVTEFYAFYQQHGAGKVDFDFSLVEIDRRLARREIAEVSPGRYYLSRDNLEAELTARGFRGRFDEVIALHAWSNANPDRALQAYGGGAVGPDGHFLGDAGFNSIPVMGRDPNTIGQVLIHEVLHNVDDMFSRSGMADEFFNADEMSRNMAHLLRERSGAFLPRYTDAEMLAFADRERQGREAYPWAMQLVYYGWMLERTPKEAWDRLRYGRMVPRDRLADRPLYSTIYTSAANDSVYVVQLGRSRLPERTYAQTDFDGSEIYSGAYHAAWLPVAGRGDTVVVGTSRVVRQRVASVAVEPDVVLYADAPSRAPVAPRVLIDRCCGDGPPLEGAAALPEGGRDAASLPLGAYDLTYTARATGWYVHPGRTHLVVRRGWSVRDDGPLTVSLGSPLTVNTMVREDRGRNDVAVAGAIEGRTLRFVPTGDGRFSATLEAELPWGLHWASITARAPDGSVVTDSVRVYVRPAGWIRVPDHLVREADGSVRVQAAMFSRMGAELSQPLPLVAIVGDEVTPLVFQQPQMRYLATLAPPRGAARAVVTSLVGDPQRRVLPIVDAQGMPPSVRLAAAPPVDLSLLPPFAAALRLASPPAIDGDLGDWPGTRAEPVRLGSRNFLLTDTAVYHGDRDLAAAIRFAWDDSTLYVGGEISDDSVTGGEAWDTDRVNLVFDMKDDTSPLSYPTDNPPLNEWQDDDYWVFWRYGGTQVRRFGKVNADPISGARLATRRTAGGWAFEVAIPRSELPGYVPFVGQVAGMQVFVTDGDGEATATELMWTAKWPYTADGIEWRLAELAKLLFIDAPSSPSSPSSPPSPSR